jgi:hypothetical protein
MYGKHQWKRLLNCCCGFYLNVQRLHACLIRIEYHYIRYERGHVLYKATHQYQRRYVMDRRRSRRSNPNFSSYTCASIISATDMANRLIVAGLRVQSH